MPMEEAGIHCKTITSEVGRHSDKKSFSFWRWWKRWTTDWKTTRNIRRDRSGDCGWGALQLFRKIFHYFRNAIILGVTGRRWVPTRTCRCVRIIKLIIGIPSKNSSPKDIWAMPPPTPMMCISAGPKVGIDGDYTVSSLDRIYMHFDMHENCCGAYKEKVIRQKTLIFNSSVATSKSVESFWSGYSN